MLGYIINIISIYSLSFIKVVPKLANQKHILLSLLNPLFKTLQITPSKFSPGSMPIRIKLSNNNNAFNLFHQSFSKSKILSFLFSAMQLRCHLPLIHHGLHFNFFLFQNEFIVVRVRSNVLHQVDKEEDYLDIVIFPKLYRRHYNRTLKNFYFEWSTRPLTTQPTTELYNVISIKPQWLQLNPNSLPPCFVFS